MSIVGIAQTSPCAPPLAETPPLEEPSTEGPQVVPQQEAPAPVAPGEQEPPAQDAEAVPPEDPEQGDGGPEGVLRLLMAGHFKGVADVRLRINFQDQLAAAAAAAVKPVAGDAVTALSNTINAQLDGALSPDGLDQEQQSVLTEAQGAFNEAVGSASEAFLGAVGLEGGALKDSLREAFESLTGALESLLVTEVPEQPEEPLPAEGAEETPPEPVQDPLLTLLEGLRGAFEAAMLELDEALNSGSPLPALSPAPGNGVAYQKFLAIYGELRVPDGADDAGVVQPVDLGA